ncbi:MAG: GAF domain-containing protein [Chloroflexales bacterium]|nr:GAF domain-containing protein [Chloroflexales bacterium]
MAPVDLHQLPRGARALYRISEAVSAGLDTQAVLDALLERTVGELGYRAAALRLLDPERRTLELRAAYGLSPAYLAKGAVEVARSGVDAEVLAGATVAVPDVRSALSFQYGEAARREGLVSAIVLPLPLRERVIGVLRVYTAAPHAFDEEERALLAAVAGLGGQAIQRAHFATALQQIAASLTASLELKAVLGTLLLRTVQALGTRAGSLRLLGPRRQTLHLAAAYGLSETYLAKGAVQVAGSGIDQHVLSQLQPLALTELSEAAGFQYPAEAQREGIRALLVAPLRAQGQAIGVLRVYAGELRQFSPEELGFTATVADLGALAIENAKLHAALKQRLEALQADSNGWQRFLTLS